MLIFLSQLHGVTFKKRAPKAIKEIKAFAYKSMVCYSANPTHYARRNYDCDSVFATADKWLTRQTGYH